MSGGRPISSGTDAHARTEGGSCRAPRPRARRAPAPRPRPGAACPTAAGWPWSCPRRSRPTRPRMQPAGSERSSGPSVKPGKERRMPLSAKAYRASGPGAAAPIDPMSHNGSSNRMSSISCSSPRPSPAPAASLRRRAQVLLRLHERLLAQQRPALAGHEAAHARDGVDQALALELLVGALGRDDADAQVARERADGRQRLVRGQRAAFGWRRGSAGRPGRRSACRRGCRW